MNGHEHYWLFGYWWIFPLVMMFFCFFFMRGWSGRGWCGFGHYTDFINSPMEILKRRYARGEIDRKEFEDRKRNLEGIQESDSF